MNKLLVLLGLRYVEGETVRLSDASWRLRLAWLASLVVVGGLLVVIRHAL